jgi:hypothetical protein
MLVLISLVYLDQEKFQELCMQGYGTTFLGISIKHYVPASSY